MTAIYRTTGTLTGTIEAENVSAAQAYLTEYDMTQFVDDSIKPAIARIEWNLHADGHNYHVEAICHRELTADEQRVLSEWVSGQNSDGLGEGFEQQEFAWVEEGDPHWDPRSEEWYEDSDGYMISFDWKTNKLPWTRVV